MTDFSYLHNFPYSCSKKKLTITQAATTTDFLGKKHQIWYFVRLILTEQLSKDRRAP